MFDFGKIWFEGEGGGALEEMWMYKGTCITGVGWGACMKGGGVCRGVRTEQGLQFPVAWIFDVSEKKYVLLFSR